MKKKTKTLVPLILGVILLAGIIVASIALNNQKQEVLTGVQSIEKLQEATGCTDFGNDMTAIAACIGQHSTLYVQLGCHYCAQQEELFGDDVEYLTIVDCFYEPEKCQDVSATPTWITHG